MKILDRTTKKVGEYITLSVNWDDNNYPGIKTGMSLEVIGFHEDRNYETAGPFICDGVLFLQNEIVTVISYTCRFYDTATGKPKELTVFPNETMYEKDAFWFSNVEEGRLSKRSAKYLVKLLRSKGCTVEADALEYPRRDAVKTYLKKRKKRVEATKLRGGFPMSKLDKYVVEKTHDEKTSHTTSLDLEPRHVKYLKGDNPKGKKLNMGMILRDYLDSLIKEYQDDGAGDL